MGTFQVHCTCKSKLQFCIMKGFSERCQSLPPLPASVSQLRWYDEDKKFAVGFSDGVVLLCAKDDFESVIPLEAHQVHPTEISLVYTSLL